MWSQTREVLKAFTCSSYSYIFDLFFYHVEHVLLLSLNITLNNDFFFKSPKGEMNKI